MKKFILPENSKSNVVNGHVFDETGSLVVSDEDAKKLENMFCQFYGIKMEDVVTEDSDEDDKDEDPGLTSDNTRGNSEND